MTKSFKRTATVEFAINGTDQTITVNNLPYIWIPAVNPDMESTAVFAAIDYLSMALKARAGLDVISVTTSPVPPLPEKTVAEIRDHTAEHDAASMRKLLDAGEPMSTTAAAQFGCAPSEAQELLDNA